MILSKTVKATFTLEHCEQPFNKRMLSDWFSAALQTNRKCGRKVFRKDGEVWKALMFREAAMSEKVPIFALVRIRWTGSRAVETTVRKSS